MYVCVIYIHIYIYTYSYVCVIVCVCECVYTNLRNSTTHCMKGIPMAFVALCASTRTAQCAHVVSCHTTRGRLPFADVHRSLFFVFGSQPPVHLHAGGACRCAKLRALRVREVLTQVHGDECHV